MRDLARRRSTHVLYRFYNAAGDLLYVGITNDPLGRFRGHADKSWFKQATSSTMEHFDTRSDLAAAEIAAIQTERPRYNKAHAGSSPSVLRVREQAQGASIFGPDASTFRAPDSIATDDRSAVETKPLRLRLPLGCPRCYSMACFREHDGLVRCDGCLEMWDPDEWKDATGV